MFILALIGGALTYLARPQKPQTYAPYDDIYASPTRDFKRIPFDVTDATHYCKKKAQNKYGDNLALSYVDEHSTRVDENTGVYKIFMIAHVGNLTNYQETAVHCFVDPYRYTLTHFRTIKLKETSIINRVFKFFE